MKTIKVGGKEYPVNNGTVKIPTDDAEALLCAQPGYEKGMRSKVAKATIAVVESIYPEVAKQMLKDKLSEDIAVVIGNPGPMVPQMTITCEKTGERTDTEGKKVPSAKYAGVITKFRPIKPSSKFKEEVVAKMAAEFEAARKKK
jgi:hypothetical protein